MKKEVKQEMEQENQKKGTAGGRRENWAACAGVFLRDEEGIGVVEIVLILVVLIGLVILFKSQLTSLMKTILNNIKGDALSI